MKKVSSGKAALTAAAFEAETRGVGNNICLLNQFLQGVSKQERQETLDAFGRVGLVSAAAIHRVLRRSGWSHNYSVIKKHRTDGCHQCGINPVRRPD